MGQAVAAEALDEHEAFRQEIRDWLAGAIPQAWRDRPPTMSLDDMVAHRRGWGKIVYESGYSGLAWPMEYGGRGFDAVKVAIFFEECAAAHAPEQLNRLGLNLAAPAIITYGTEAQKQRFLPGILKGEEIWCEGFSEPNAGSDLAAVSTTARFDGERWLINGSKIWTSFAHLADRIYLLAKTSPDGSRHQNLTVFLMNMRQPGVDPRPLKQITGRAEFNQVFFDDAVAHPDEVLGVVNDGWRLATIGAGSLRASKVGEGTWHHYVEMRVWLDKMQAQVDESGIANPHIQPLRDRLDLMWWHISRAAGVLKGSEGFLPMRGEAQVIKLQWSHLAHDIVAAGLAASNQKDRAYWRDQFLEARPTTIYGGSSQLRRNVLADQVLRLRKR